MDFDEDTIGSSLTIAPGGGDAGGRRAPLLGRIDQYDLLEKLGGGGFRVALVPAD
ncbi:MAG: hypothetical protein IJP66_05055 [Kiritimatiellae bacterium]|nr:hypothetical protein [Kiritimatiellia bacterium]